MKEATQAPGWVPYWLIVRHSHSQMEVLSTKLATGQRALPVFSLEEEARSFLQAAVESGWQIRKTGCGELVSVLFGPCRDVKRVALDPSPEITLSAAADLVSVSREGFLDSLLGRGRSWFDASYSKQRRDVLVSGTR